MAEWSGKWTTNAAGSGDQVAGYTQAYYQILYEVLAACLGFEGVAPGYLNELEGSVTGANTVEMNTGGALVDGHVYQNGAAEEVNIPNAVGAGNTRIDRIVLRCDWSAYTVRLTRIAGTDASSPSAPAITQTSGTTYDILLYQALVNTSGDVTLTDERTWAAANKIADDVVDADAIADDAVGIDQIGDLVVGLLARQGGGATDWDDQGVTTYTPGGVRVQVGSKQVTISAGSASSSSQSITFPEAFGYAPLIWMQPRVTTGGISQNISAHPSSISDSGFSVIVYRSGSTSADLVLDIYWLAIGPE